MAEYPACRKAIDELVRLIGELPAPLALMGPDEVWRWWDARSKVSVSAARQSGETVLLEAECAYDGGFVLRIPTGQSSARACTVDGASASFESTQEFGQNWAFIPLAAGRHAVEVLL